MELRTVKYFWVSFGVLFLSLLGVLLYVLQGTSGGVCEGLGCVGDALVLISAYLLAHVILFIVCAIAARKDLKNSAVSDDAKQYVKKAVKIFWILFACSVLLMASMFGSRTEVILQRILMLLPTASFLVPIIYLQVMLKLDKTVKEAV